MVEQNVLTVEVPTVEAPAYTLLGFTEDERNRTTFLELNIYGTSLNEWSGSGMTSITPWILHVHYIKMGYNSYGRGPGAHFENDETPCWCFNGLTEVRPYTE